MSRHFIGSMSSLWQAADEQDWGDALFSLAREYGFERTLFAVVPNPAMRFADAYVRTNIADDWCRLYEAEGFVDIDPRVAHCLTQTCPLVWSGALFATASQQRLHDAAKRYGLDCGVVLPIHGPKGEAGMLCLCASETTPDALNRHLECHLPTLSLLRDVAFDTAPPFFADYADAFIPRLTPRECECLKWIAHGKSTWDIAQIVGCSEATVNFHMTNIRSKFGVSSRSAAAIKAVRMGLIDID